MDYLNAADWLIICVLNAAISLRGLTSGALRLLWPTHLAPPSPAQHQ